MAEKEVQKQDDAVFTDEVRKALPEEAQDYIKSLETQLAASDGEEDGEVDLLKAMPEDVRKFVDDLEKRTKDAESIAKHERNVRLTKEWTDKAASYSKLAVEAKPLGLILKRLDEDSPTDREALETILAAANEQMEKSASLFGEIGAAGASESDSVSDKIDKMASGLVAKGEVTDYIEAINKLQADPEHRSLFEQFNTQKN